jgi:hypothetical protein
LLCFVTVLAGATAEADADARLGDTLARALEANQRCEHPAARAAIDAMLRATADEVTRPGAPRGCMLILAAPTGAIENSGVREFLAGLRRDMLDTTRDRLARGIADGDITVSPASLDAIARYYTTLVQGLSVQARDGASRADLEAVVTCAMAAWDTLVSADGY